MAVGNTMSVLKQVRLRRPREGVQVLEATCSVFLGNKQRCCAGCFNEVQWKRSANILVFVDSVTANTLSRSNSATAEIAGELSQLERLKAGTHYPCSRAVLTGREHG